MERKGRQHCVKSAGIGFDPNTLESILGKNRSIWFSNRRIIYTLYKGPTLAHHIDTQLIHRKSNAITNFKTTLPTLDSDLATDVLKDPYVFDFITTGDESKERHLQQALLANIRRFLLELGVGFMFVGSNYHIVVGNEEFYIDLLFYHIRLHCYIVIELKAGSFKPEYVGV